MYVCEFWVLNKVKLSELQGAVIGWDKKMGQGEEFIKSIVKEDERVNNLAKTWERYKECSSTSNERHEKKK
jgi:hypothetical protein